MEGVGSSFQTGYRKKEISARPIGQQRLAPTYTHFSKSFAEKKRILRLLHTPALRPEFTEFSYKSFLYVCPQMWGSFFFWGGSVCVQKSGSDANVRPFFFHISYRGVLWDYHIKCAVIPDIFKFCVLVQKNGKQDSCCFKSLLLIV